MDSNSLDSIRELHIDENPSLGAAVASSLERIVEAHEWDIDVASGTDGGARFEITAVEFGDR